MRRLAFYWAPLATAVIVVVLLKLGAVAEFTIAMAVGLAIQWAVLRLSRTHPELAPGPQNLGRPT